MRWFSWTLANAGASAADVDERARSRSTDCRAASTSDRGSSTSSDRGPPGSTNQRAVSGSTSFVGASRAEQSRLQRPCFSLGEFQLL